MSQRLLSTHTQAARSQQVEDLKICKVVVAERTPADGLEERSSTSMKARLREMVLREVAEEESQAKKQKIEA